MSHEEVFKTSAFKWEICNCCHGEGKVGHSAFDNGITSEEWEEMRHDCDGEGVSEAEKYLSGAYDVLCSECKGSGKVRTPDESRMGTLEKRAYRLWQREQHDIAESRYADERMRQAEMGWY